MLISRDQLQAIFPLIQPSIAQTFTPALNEAMAEFKIDSPRRIAAFLAQVLHESVAFSRLTENLNYSAQRLMTVWPRRFTDMALARAYEHNPPALANYVYANRGGNGDASTGDGWRYRGAGCIQLTFKDNHAKCAEYFGIPVEALGDWLRTPEGACRSAAWFWTKAGCNARADIGDFDGVCDLINIGRKTERIGDAIGYTERLSICRDALEVLSQGG